MSYQYLLDSQTTAKRILAIVLGSIEVGLGVVRVIQGFEQRNLITILDGLNAIACGAKSIVSGWGGEGETWLDLGKEVRRLVCLYFRIKELRPLLQFHLELTELLEQA
jgi:hypothetical protein